MQFENLVLNDLDALKRTLGIGPTPLLGAAPFVQKRTQRKKGCQVDRMLLTKHAVRVVEIKRRQRIGPEVVAEVAEKVRRLPSTGRRSVRTALAYHGELDARVAAEGYFDALVPFGELLAPPG